MTDGPVFGSGGSVVAVEVPGVPTVSVTRKELRQSVVPPAPLGGRTRRTGDRGETLYGDSNRKFSTSVSVTGTHHRTYVEGMGCGNSDTSLEEVREPKTLPIPMGVSRP